MSLSHVGYLVPLNQNLEEEASVPKLPVSDGTNIIGRNNFSVSDKRLSRKHLTLTASPDGSANLHVVGTNPIVVNSRNKRRKLNTQETATISDGDIIELIPGHHLLNIQCCVATKDLRVDEIETRSVEQGRNAVIKKPVHSQSCQEAIRDFHVPNDKIPSTFRLLRVQGLPSWANTSCVSINDVIQEIIGLSCVISLLLMQGKAAYNIQTHNGSGPSLNPQWGSFRGDILIAILSNYMVDIDWLVPGEPDLQTGSCTNRHSWQISFGTHHSKAILLGIYLEDGQNSLLSFHPLETSVYPSFFKKFDYSDAMVRLVASVPGYHTGTGLKKWGHMKLRSLLQDCTFDEQFKKSPLVYQILESAVLIFSIVVILNLYLLQFSSLGSLDEKWMAELASSMSAGLSEDKVPLGLGEPQIIWPTVEDVRCSLEGSLSATVGVAIV
ncbi:Tyrosyl-DNA phosphodiesterase I [Sesbania bispinosa]|nr:Tyrosyl-DNA phosphodiesterase I [Sesbania bispinosa]